MISSIKFVIRKILKSKIVTPEELQYIFSIAECNVNDRPLSRPLQMEEQHRITPAMLTMQRQIKPLPYIPFKTDNSVPQLKYQSEIQKRLKNRLDLARQFHQRWKEVSQIRNDVNSFFRILYRLNSFDLLILVIL